MGRTPADDGMSMPAEWERHERCLMAWPTDVRRSYWTDDRDYLPAARDAYAAVARAIARFEPVLMVANVGDGQGAATACGPEVEVVELPIDDSWMRDNGPIFVRRAGGARAGVHFGFNAWGSKLAPYDADASLAEPLCAYLGLPRYRAPFILEGGSIAVDGAGTLVTTERCLLHPNRNPGLSRGEIEDGLRAWLGVERIVWLPDAIVEDDGTDGHVDNAVAFVRPGLALLQSTDDASNPNYAVARENRRRLEAAGIEVVEIDALPYVTVGSKTVPVPYVNFYLANSGVVVPVTGHPADEAMLARIAACYPDRRVVGVPGEMLAFGGGGVHCITQQVPA
ncbi:MAG TPA: agmatine deiminase family protein [Chloroflexota bacterium]|nr:agmatine deiminase family protein [Chloroflexota bacterium]